MLMVVFICSTSIYGSLKFYHDLSLGAYLVFPSATLTCIIVAVIVNPISGNITGHATQFKDSWNEWNAQHDDLIGKDDKALPQFKDQSFLHKILASCADVQVKMGIFYPNLCRQLNQLSNYFLRLLVRSTLLRTLDKGMNFRKC